MDKLKISIGYNGYLKTELIEECKHHGLPYSANKKELLSARILEHYKNAHFL